MSEYRAEKTPKPLSVLTWRDGSNYIIWLGHEITHNRWLNNGCPGPSLFQHPEHRKQVSRPCYLIMCLSCGLCQIVLVSINTKYIFCPFIRCLRYQIQKSKIVSSLINIVDNIPSDDTLTWVRHWTRPVRSLWWQMAVTSPSCQDSGQGETQGILSLWLNSQELSEYVGIFSLENALRMDDIKIHHQDQDSEEGQVGVDSLCLRCHVFSACIVV